MSESRILDANGRPIKLAAQTPDLAVLDWPEKYGWDSLTQTKPEDVADAMYDATFGRTQAFYDLCEKFYLSDAHLRAEVDKRIRPVSKIRVKIIAADVPGGEELADKYQNYFDQIRNFRTGCKTLLEAPGWGFGAIQLFGKINSAGDLVIDRVEGEPQRRFVIRKDGTFGLYSQTGDWEKGDPLPGEGLAGPPKILIHKITRHGSIITAGFMWSCIWYALLKNFTWKDRMSFQEVFGFPFRLGLYPRNASPKEKKILREAVLKLAANAAAIIPDDQKIEFKDVNKNGAAALYAGTNEILDHAISKAVLGSVLSSNAVSRGTQALGKVQDEARDDVKEEDSSFLSETLTHELLRPWIIVNEGEQSEYPTALLEVVEQEDLDNKMKRDTTALKSGVKIGQRYFQNTYGYPEIDDNDEVVTLPQTVERANSPNTNKPLEHTTKTHPFQKSFARSTVMLEVPRAAVPGRADGLQLNIDGIAEGAINELAPLYDELIDALLQNKDRAGAIRKFRDALTIGLTQINSIGWLAGYVQVEGETQITTPVVPLDESGPVAKIKLARALKPTPEQVRLVMLADSAQVAKFKSVIPREELEIWRSMTGLSEVEYYAMEKPLRAAAWTISGLESKHVIYAVDAGIDLALRQGITEREFKKFVRDHAAKAGVASPNPHHLRLAFRQNLFTVRSAAREQALLSPAVKSALPWWQFAAVMDERTRDTHAALHGFQAPAGDSSFPRPPLDFMCRCDWFATTNGEKMDIPLAAEGAIREGFGAPGDLLRAITKGNN